MTATYPFSMSMGNGSWSIRITKETSGTGAYAGNYPYTVTINGQVVGSGTASYDFRDWGYDQTGSITLASGGYSPQDGLNSGTATYSGGYSNTTASASYTYSAPSYAHKITYDANGGVNAPEETNAGNSSTKNSFTGTLTQSSPTREGYSFDGWALESDASDAIYQPGGTYTFTSQNVKLYAIWKQNTFIKVDGTWVVGQVIYVKKNKEWVSGSPRIKYEGAWKS